MTALGSGKREVAQIGFSPRDEPPGGYAREVEL